MFVVAFFGLMRVGEITMSKDKVVPILIDQVRLTPDLVTITITKFNQKGSGCITGRLGGHTSTQSGNAHFISTQFFSIWKVDASVASCFDRRHLSFRRLGFWRQL